MTATRKSGEVLVQAQELKEGDKVWRQSEGHTNEIRFVQKMDNGRIGVSFANGSRWVFGPTEQLYIVG